jgi:hypothetical protein
MVLTDSFSATWGRNCSDGWRGGGGSFPQIFEKRCYFWCKFNPLLIFCVSTTLFWLHRNVESPHAQNHERPDTLKSPTQYATSVIPQSAVFVGRGEKSGSSLCYQIAFQGLRKLGCVFQTGSFFCAKLFLREFLWSFRQSLKVMSSTQSATQSSTHHSRQLRH